MSHSIFGSIEEPPPDAIFGINSLYLASTAPEKVNLVIGAYRTNDGKPWVLPCIQAADKILHESHPNQEYLPIDGEEKFREASRIVMFGREWNEKNATRTATCQSLSGTGGLRLGFEFFKKFFPGRTVYLPNPTWGMPCALTTQLRMKRLNPSLTLLENHKNIVLDCGFKCEQYAYYNPQTKGLDFEGYQKSLKEAPKGSIFLLHAVAHNPTGVDPTPEQWQVIAKLIQENNHLTYFDSAYQGFASGDLEKDSYAINLWNNLEQEFVVAQSFAKNFGLYGTRTGAFHVVTKYAIERFCRGTPLPYHVSNPAAAKAVSGQLKRLVRALYSNPPNYGARLVSIVVHTPELFEMWKADMKVMSDRLLQCREMLYNELQKLGTPGDWTHIKKQIGMFTYTGLTTEQVEKMITHYHVFLLKSGRISLAGINTNNVAYIATAIDGVVTGKCKL